MSFLLGCAVALSTLGASKEIGPGANVAMEVAALNPGDELVLRGGMYTLPTSRWLIDRNGTAQLPIVIRSKTGERAHLHRPDANQNLADISSRHLVFRELEFSGGSAGLRFLGGASFITIEGCNLHETEDVAIRANDTGGSYEGFRILRNEVHHTQNGTAEGMYLGCHPGNCSFFNGLIEGNWVHHINAPNVTQGDGIEIKDNSYGNVVRDNVIHDTNYPCITLYSARTTTNAPNIVERNVMWNCGDHGIQVSKDAVIRNNIILEAAAEGISVRSHAAVMNGSGNVQVINNTVLAPSGSGSAIAIRDATSAITVANNAVYTAGSAGVQVVNSGSFVTLTNNVGVGGGPMLVAGNLTADLVGANLSGTVPNNVFPKAGGALIGAAAAASAPMEDFNGTQRTAPHTVGAYQAAASNPGWVIVSGFKPTSGGAGGSAGGGSAGGGSAGGGSAGGGSAGGGSTAGGSAAGGSAGAGLAGGATAGGTAGGGAAMTGCGCQSSTTTFVPFALAAIAVLGALLRRRSR